MPAKQKDPLNQRAFFYLLSSQTTINLLYSINNCFESIWMIHR